MVIVGLPLDQSKGIASKKIINVGPVSYNEVFSFYEAADVFCLPALYEPFGLVYLEALSTGLPIVGSMGTGADEIISKGKNGFLCKKRNPKDIASAILDAEKLGRVKPVSGFSWKESAKKLVKLYDSIE